MTLPRALPIALLVLGCATSLTERGRQARETGTDPAPIVATLEQEFSAIDATKRIFSVTLIEGRRRFAGEGAIDYVAYPRRIDADVFGPHDTPVVHVAVRGDSVHVRLPQEGRIITGAFGDPVFSDLAGEQALASPEVLGAILGAYDVPDLVVGADWIGAEEIDDRDVLYISVGEDVHAFAVERETGRLIEYVRERERRLVYRVRFDDFRSVDGRESPRRVVLRDFVKERQLVFEIESERS